MNRERKRNIETLIKSPFEDGRTLPCLVPFTDHWVTGFVRSRVKISRSGTSTIYKVSQNLVEDLFMRPPSAQPQFISTGMQTGDSLRGFNPIILADCPAKVFLYPNY